MLLAGAALPIGLTGFRRMVYNSKAGISGGTILTSGDSTTAGTGTTAISGTYPYQLYSTLLAAGLPVVFDAACGNAATDSRVVLTASATKGGQAQCCPGYNLSFAAANLAFTPVSQVDTFDIYLIKGGATGTATVSINGGATLATLSTNAANGVQKVTVTGTKGTNTLNILQTAGSVWLQHIDAYDSTAKKIRIIGMGYPGSTSNNYIDSGTVTFSPCQGVRSATPNLVIFNMGINDCNTSVAMATYQTQMQSFISAVKGYGELMLIGYNSIGTGPTEATIQTYISTVLSLASTNGLTYKDIHAISPNWATYAAANAATLMSDTLHPNTAGYSQIGPFIAAPLLIGV